MYAIVILIAFAAVLLCKSVAGFQPVVQDRVVYAESNRIPSSAACQFPARPGISAEQTAWQIFVAATCPVVAGHTPAIAWKDWTELQRAYFAGGEINQHDPSSGVSRRTGGKTGSSTAFPGPSWECTARHSGRTICEDIRVNPAMAEWLSATSGSSPRIVPIASTGGEMLPPLVEIKADWIKLASCAYPPQGAHVERVGSTCYELGGINMVSELFNGWISATFEIQDMASNPMRCRVVGCRDPWGSVPSMSRGGAAGNTRISVELSSLMQEANLGSEWLNYRLDEAQMSAIDSLGNLLPLENASVPEPGTRAEMGLASKAAGEGSEANGGMWGAPIMPMALEDDTPTRRASLLSIGTRCPGEEMGRECPSGVLPRKVKMKRRTG